MQRLLKINVFVNIIFLSGFCAVAQIIPQKVLQKNIPQIVVDNDNLTLKFGNEMMVMPDGIQPNMICTKKGTLLVQATPIRDTIKPSAIGHLPMVLKTIISRDKGKSWKTHVFNKKFADPSFEGGMIQLRSGKILLLDTYILPGKDPHKGKAVLYTSNNDLKTIEGPFAVTVHLPDADYYSSADDGGNTNNAQRFHRRIIQLPNGDLLTTMYGHFKGDTISVNYEPAMKKFRTSLLRSSDEGRTWKLVTHITDANGISEGYGEAVLARITNGAKTGRIICFMRTGENLYQSISDDDGNTWSKPAPLIFANIDVIKKEQWAAMFSRIKRKEVWVDAKPGDLTGAVVDPDLIELKSGLLIAAVGIRIPHHACFENPQHPWNGNYIAISTDQGETWGTVVQLTSGIPTTHYMTVEAVPCYNKVFIVYDYGSWGKHKPRYVYGRTLSIKQ